MTNTVAGMYPLSAISTYSSTKAFNIHLAKCLNYEFRGKIDIYSFNPGVMTTKLSGVSTTGLKSISEERAAEVMFRDLGSTDHSIGSFRHEVFGNLMLNCPNILTNPTKRLNIVLP